jgi:hypothetical protein
MQALQILERRNRNGVKYSNKKPRAPSMRFFLAHGWESMNADASEKRATAAPQVPSVSPTAWWPQVDLE